MARRTTEKTSLAERAETAIIETKKKETAVVKKPKKETAVMKKEKAETAVVKKEKASTAVVKKEKAERAVVKKEKGQTALAKSAKTAAKGRNKKYFNRENLAYIDIVNYVREKLKATDAGVISGRAAYQVDVTGQGSGIFYIEIVDGFLAVEPYDYRDRDARLVVSSDDLLDIVEEKLNIDKALTEGRLYVDGNWDRAMELKKLLAQL